MRKRGWAAILLICLAVVLLSGCSRPAAPTVFDDLERAQQYTTVADLEKWLGEPLSVEPMYELETRELPGGATLTNAEGESLGHGEYQVAVESGRELREYEPPEHPGARICVFAEKGHITRVVLQLPPSAP